LLNMILGFIQGQSSVKSQSISWMVIRESNVARSLSTQEILAYRYWSVVVDKSLLFCWILLLEIKYWIIGI
jgi:hypothetical protein